MCNNSTVKKIDKNWSIDGLDDKTYYFYSYDEVMSVLNGDYCFVLGRKGSGKSALFTHIKQISLQTNFYSESLSLKNIPKKTKNNHKVNLDFYELWKTLIYHKICKMLSINQSITLKGVNELNQVLGYDNWCLDSFNLGILNILKLGFSNKKINTNISFEETSNAFESFVIQNCDYDSTYYIVFDELDLDYNDVRQLKNGETYHDVILALLRAVVDIKKMAEKHNFKIIPIAFLRDDIFNQLKFSDKNKYIEKSLFINWTPKTLKQLLTYRIIHSDHKIIGKDFKAAMNSIFDTNLNIDEVFRTIIDLSQNRPRDIIMYIKTCCHLAVQNQKDFIDHEIMKIAEISYTDSLKQEIIDEFFPVFNKYEDLFSLLTGLNQIFTFQEFRTQLEEHQEQFNLLKNYNANQLIELLFDYNIIGYISHKERMSKDCYKYMEKNLTFNYNSSIVVHPGLRNHIHRFYSIIDERHSYLLNYSQYY